MLSTLEAHEAQLIPVTGKLFLTMFSISADFGVKVKDPDQGVIILFPK